MKKLLSILLFLPAFFSLILCQEVISLVPLAPEGNQVNGREYIPLSSDQIRVELAYDGTSGENLVFDLVIFNETSRKLIVKPSGFYSLGLDNPDADSSSYPLRRAVAPAQVYKWYDRALEEPESEKTINTIMDFVEAGVGMLSGVSAFLSTENPAFIVDAVFNTAGSGGQVVGEREMIREEMMQEEELEAGEVINGFVCFPGHPESTYLMFCFPIDDQEFQFVYQLHSDQ